MSLSAGTRIAAYEILGPLGAGGMGEVYRARDARLDRIVAIKILPAHVAADLTLKQRFEREAKALAALSHPNICAVFDVGLANTEQGGVDFLVMEYLQGETLAQRLGRGTPSRLFRLSTARIPHVCRRMDDGWCIAPIAPAARRSGCVRFREAPRPACPRTGEKSRVGTQQP